MTPNYHNSLVLWSCCYSLFHFDLTFAPSTSSSRSWSTVDMPRANFPRTFRFLGGFARIGVGLRGRISAEDVSWGIWVCALQVIDYTLLFWLCSQAYPPVFHGSGRAVKNKMTTHMESHQMNYCRWTQSWCRGRREGGRAAENNTQSFE